MPFNQHSPGGHPALQKEGGITPFCDYPERRRAEIKECRERVLLWIGVVCMRLCSSSALRGQKQCESFVKKFCWKLVIFSGPYCNFALRGKSKNEKF
jgi:hypothetical protein